jgi:hypothetical protein
MIHREGRLGQSQMSQAQPLGKKKWQYACWLSGMNKLKEGFMWHVDPLLGNDGERSSYTTVVTE